MKYYEADLGFLQMRTVKSLRKKIKGHGDIIINKIYLIGIGVRTKVVNCDEIGKEIIERHFERWRCSPLIEWKEMEQGSNP